MRAVILACLAIAATGCESTGSGPRLTLPGLEQGTDSGSARTIEQLEALLDAADYEGVVAHQEATIATWPAADRNAYWRLKARAWLALEDSQAALDAIANLTERQGTDYLLIGAVCERAGDFTCAADGYVQASLDLGMGHPDLPGDLNDTIWRALSSAQPRDGRLGPAAYSHRYHFAWWQLQAEIRDAATVSEHIRTWQAWRDNHPSHPAVLNPPSNFVNYDSYRAPKLGVILPMSGQLASAGNALRDGMIAAFLSASSGSDAGNHDQPIVFYDSQTASLTQIWEQTEADGVDAVVGPLLKQNAEQFAELTHATNTPVLLLNYITDLAQPVLGDQPFQIGVAIEDEATSLAEHAVAEGRRNVLVVHNQSRWAQRALSSILRHWPYALLTAPFEDIRGLTDAVGTAMDVDASHRRLNEIAAIIAQPVEFSPRARTDLDGVIALTNQMESLALVPALRFHFADHLPLYGTSQVLRGNATDTLGKFQVTQLPMQRAEQGAMKELVTAYELQHSALAELYALGYDAFHVASWLPILTPHTPLTINGASGTLVLEPGGRIRRQLEVAPARVRDLAQRSSD